MLYLSLIFTGFVLTFILVKFIEKIAYIAGIMFSLTVLGILIIPFNMDLGVKVAMWMFCLLVMLGVLFLFSGLLSAIIVTPIMLLWGSIKGLFKSN